MKDLTTLIQERAAKGKLNSLSIIAAANGRGKAGAPLFKAACRAADGVLSTGEHTDPIEALTAALRGDNAGINRTKKRSGARPSKAGDDEDFDFG